MDDGGADGSILRGPALAALALADPVIRSRTTRFPGTSDISPALVASAALRLALVRWGGQYFDWDEVRYATDLSMKLIDTGGN